MKKLVFMFVAVAAISFASCGGSSKQAPVEAEVVEEDTVAVVDTLADSTAVDSTAAVETPAE